MNSLSKALDWADLGFSVIPCWPTDKWDRDFLQKAKAPITPRGLNDASKSSEVITKWFTDHPEALVGVLAEGLAVADIDVDLEKGLDGGFELEERQLKLPPTFHYETPRGGSHYIYKSPNNELLGPMAPIKDSEGNSIPGVDRRSGPSYFIAWSETVPNSKDEFAEAPDWLSLNPSRNADAKQQYSKGLAAWLESCPQGPLAEPVAEIISAIPPSDFNHAQMISLQSRLVIHAAAGLPGVPAALYHLQEAWLRKPYDTPKYEKDWINALEGAVAKFGALQTDNDSFESEVNEMVRRKKVSLEAEARISAEGFTGSEILSWSEMQNRREYLVQDLLPRKGIAFLVARPNIGKTLAYLDMVLSSIFEIDWLGKKTEKFKTMIVVSEGVSGFVSRIEAWCEYHHENFDEVKKWILPVDGANLNNRASLDRLSKHAREFQADLIVFDTYSNTSGVADEDKAALNAITLQNATKIRPDSSILFIHHPNLSTEKTTKPKMRGSSALAGRADVVMTLINDPSGVADKNGHSQLVLSTDAKHGGKNRDAPQETISGIKLAREGLPAPVFVGSESGEVFKMRRLIDTHLVGVMTSKQFAKSAGVSEKTAERQLKSGVIQGMVELEKPKAVNKPYLYWAVPSRVEDASVNWRNI